MGDHGDFGDYRASSSSSMAGPSGAYMYAGTEAKSNNLFGSRGVSPKELNIPARHGNGVTDATLNTHVKVLVDITAGEKDGVTYTDNDANGEIGKGFGQQAGTFRYSDVDAEGEPDDMVEQWNRQRKRLIQSPNTAGLSGYGNVSENIGGAQESREKKPKLRLHFKPNKEQKSSESTNKTKKLLVSPPIASSYMTSTSSPAPTTGRRRQNAAKVTTPPKDINKLPTTDKAGRRALAKKSMETGDELFGILALAQPHVESHTPVPNKRKRKKSETPLVDGYTNGRKGSKNQKAASSEIDYSTTSLSHSPPIRESTPGRPIKVHEEAIQIFDQLAESASSFGVQDELPCLFDKDKQPMRWTAKQLAHVFIYSYQQNEFHFCDLVADTWIRAFHKANNAIDKKDGNGREKNRPWLKKSFMYQNPELYKEKEDVLLPKQYFRVKEIKLGSSVTTITSPNSAKRKKLDMDNESLLECVNLIYHATSRACPTRLLFADMLTLHGYPLSLMLNRPPQSHSEPRSRNCENNEQVSGDRTGLELHADLVWDIMSTSLRMVRSKLTLKCEEMIEGAWCNRYHFHATFGQDCYRVLAKKEREAEEVRKKLEEARNENSVSFAEEGIEVNVDDEIESEEE